MTRHPFLAAAVVIAAGYATVAWVLFDIDRALRELGGWLEEGR